MAKSLFKPDKVVHEFEDGTPLIDCCEDVDVSLSFGCTEGNCGVCELTVLKGMENLSQVSEEEKEYLYEDDIAKGMRLGCQLKVKRVDVTLTWKTHNATKK